MPAAPPHSFPRPSSQRSLRAGRQLGQGSLQAHRPPAPLGTGVWLSVGGLFSSVTPSVLCPGWWTLPSVWLAYTAVPGEKSDLSILEPEFCAVPSMGWGCAQCCVGLGLSISLHESGLRLGQGCAAFPGLPSQGRPDTIHAPGSVRSGFRSQERFRSSRSLRSEPGP